MLELTKVLLNCKCSRHVADSNKHSSLLRHGIVYRRKTLCSAVANVSLECNKLQNDLKRKLIIQAASQARERGRERERGQEREREGVGF